jgi:hypothetical protein
VIKIGELGTTQAATSNRSTLRVFLRSVRQLLFTANVPSLPIFVNLMKEALSFSVTSVLQKPHGVTSQKTPFFKCQFHNFEM